MCEVFAIIWQEGYRLFGIESKIFDDDQNKQFEERFWAFRVGSVIYLVYIDLCWIKLQEYVLLCSNRHNF